ncbi:hypothetical protein BDFB_010385 [Asbolus verrucosus]|uniref:Uncharacterized protein n=1 Tax=Asbolus verrucosus TaxID=1661398 RepID=A0A482VG43_ASBVE|nr:hypothetical protein BDFB_010385 [Asbolus verrucosus]
MESGTQLDSDYYLLIIRLGVRNLQYISAPRPSVYIYTSTVTEINQSECACIDSEGIQANLSEPQNGFDRCLDGGQRDGRTESTHSTRRFHKGNQPTLVLTRFGIEELEGETYGKLAGRLVMVAAASNGANIV